MASAFHPTYWLGEGCQNTFVLFDLLQHPELFSDTFVTYAHECLLTEQRDDALILLPMGSTNHLQRIKMVIVEPDGSFAAFCGNGARVIAAYWECCLHRDPQGFTLVTADEQKDHPVTALGDGYYRINLLSALTIPQFSHFLVRKAALSCIKEAQDIWRFPLEHDGRAYSLYFAQTGEPHFICFAALSREELIALGQLLNMSYRSHFPHGINLNAVTIVDDATIAIRTYERGVNRITMSCGTGAACSARISQLRGAIGSPVVTVSAEGGELVVEYRPYERHLLLSGPAHVWRPDEKLT